MSQPDNDRQPGTTLNPVIRPDPFGDAFTAILDKDPTVDEAAKGAIRGMIMEDRQRVERGDGLDRSYGTMATSIMKTVVWDLKPEGGVGKVGFDGGTPGATLEELDRIAAGYASYTPKMAGHRSRELGLAAAWLRSEHVPARAQPGVDPPRETKQPRKSSPPRR
jgi:hypothetical protein